MARKQAINRPGKLPELTTGGVRGVRRIGGTRKTVAHSEQAKSEASDALTTTSCLNWQPRLRGKEGRYISQGSREGSWEGDLYRE